MSREIRPLRGRCRIPGDKSISHRALLLAAISPGQSVIRGLASAGDCATTLAAVRRLGAGVELAGNEARIAGPLPPAAPARLEVDCGRSGTTMRLLAGILAGHGQPALLTGAPQLLARPMERVAAPLRLMGAAVHTSAGGRPPLEVGGGALRGITYLLPVASAQVKSAILLAGLWASGRTRVEEEVPTRDHTERLMAAMGAAVERGEAAGRSWTEVRPSRLGPIHLQVPGDASSAAVLGAAAALVPGSRLTLESVSANPTRTAFFRLLGEMGAVVEAGPPGPGPEPAADLTVAHRQLRGVAVAPTQVAQLVDELPLVGLLGTQAAGITTVRGAGELRVKESDRIAVLVEGLRRLGAVVEEFEDGFAVHGPCALRGGRVDTAGDHRMAMTFSLAGLISEAPVAVSGADFIADSFPEFGAVLEAVR